MVSKIRLCLEWERDSVFALFDEDGFTINDGYWVEDDTDEWSAKLPDEILAHPQLKELSLRIMELMHVDYPNDYYWEHVVTPEEEQEINAKIQELRHIVFDEIRLQDKYEIEDLLPKSLDECENC